MKPTILLTAILMLAVAWPVRAQLVTPGGGSGAASSIQFTNGALPVSSTSAASQCLQTNAGNTGVVLGSCGGGGSYPAGNAPQIGGFSALNTSEAETVSGDFTFTRAGANSYTAAVTKTNGTAFTALATAAVPLSVANGGHGSSTAPSAGQLPIAQSATSYTPQTLSGDSTVTSAGVMANLGLHFGAANAVGLPVTPPTSGGIPFFSSTTTLASSSLLTANLPVIGGGAGLAPTVGTVSGNTTKFVTTTGTLTSNDCAKWDASGNLIDNGSTCGAGGGVNPIYTHTITEAGGAATMVVQSSAIAALDTDYVALNANATITTPAAAGMADGQELYLVGTTSGTGWTVGFTAGTGVTLATIVVGDGTPFGTPIACGTVPATGAAWFKWKYSSSNTTLTLIACGINAPPSSLALSIGGTGATSLGSWPIGTTVNTSVSGATNLGPSANFWVTNQDVTMTASATLTLTAPTFANQVEPFKICQNATGGFTPTLVAGGGLTITGTLPTCTTTASKCCDFELYFDSGATAYVTGYNNGPI